jgi:ribosomal protein S18 acetylase RimI-like enzyme
VFTLCIVARMGDEVRNATESDRERVVATVVAAFVADPAFRYFFPDDATYAQSAATFAGWLFDARVATGTAWVAAGGVAVAMWDPPAVNRSEQAPLILPPEDAARLAAYNDAVHDLIPAQPHWYLGVLATHPGHAGRRLGRTVMAAGLARAAEVGLQSVLETTNIDNVELYRRSGWDVLDTAVVDGLRVWVMTYPAEG